MNDARTDGLDLTGVNSLDLPGAPADTRVVVAMSGGVDSSVVAALLKHQGYDVVGITLQLYDHGKAVQRKGACCAGQDIEDARRVADSLSIPHYVLNYQTRFSEQVIEEFADSYLLGETPIPCIKCNQEIKFKDLLETARDLGAQALATGHYVESRQAVIGQGAESLSQRQMFRAKDVDKDQSYFLFTTTQEQLDFLRFPLGGMTKTQTRELAKQFGLKIADKPDSQDICFVPSGRYSQVIEKLRPDAAAGGDIVHEDGRVLGKHEGILHYTIGQRRGIGIAAPEPLYVVRLDADARQVIVGPRGSLMIHNISLRNVNWLGETKLDNLPVDGIEIYAMVRSSQKLGRALLRYADYGVRVELIEGESGVAPGQACVFFETGEENARMLGGGWIKSAHQHQKTVLPEVTQSFVENIT